MVDLETTGADPVRDRITEIAIIRVERGEVVSRWQSLVNPQRRIPPLIRKLIGITDDMVANAPTFAELADQVRGMLEGAVFVAHNARFDYGFLCNEYARLDQRFTADVLCTVKLSRALYPEHHRHGLDALIARHGFVCDARHRAMGDAEVVWQFVQQAGATFETETLARARAKAMKQPPRPPALPEGALEGLPDAPGTYQLYGESATPLLTGSANSLRAHLLAFVATRGNKKKSTELIDRIRRIEWQEAAGEFDALLRELLLNRELFPDCDTDSPVFGLRLLPGRERAPIFEQVPLHGSDPADWDEVFGLFRARREADNFLREQVSLYRLCPRRLGLENSSKGACSAHRQKRCAGVCAGKESVEAHDQRLRGALSVVRLKTWPWPGVVTIHERSPNSNQEAFHLFDNWCYLGSAKTRASLLVLAQVLAPRRFDIDIYRLLQRWLMNEDNRAKAVPLNSLIEP